MQSIGQANYPFKQNNGNRMTNYMIKIFRGGGGYSERNLKYLEIGDG